MLIMNEHTVPLSKFIDELWLTEPPVTVIATMQTYIYQLRKLLDIGGAVHAKGVALLTESAGYALKVPPENIDLFIFERCFKEGRISLAEGDYERAVRSLNSALSVWRSTALADIGKGPFLEAYSAQLEEARLQALELRIEADLHLGRHLDAIRELKSLIITHPMHEGFHTKLMLALHRSGRRHEALDTYNKLRKSMVDDLGLEPSLMVQRLQRAVLADDPSLIRQGADSPAAPSIVVPPAQLPPDTADFSGRASTLTNIELMLEKGGDNSPPSVVSLTGMAGVGKTALVVRLGHRLRRHYPDGQFFTRLTSSDGTPVDPRSVLEGFLRAIGFRPDQATATLEGRSELFRSWCAERRALIVLDDAASPEQVRPLLPAGAHCAVLMTSRSPLYGLDGARTVEIEPLSTNEAVELLARISGNQWTERERKAAHTIAKLSDHLPIAIRAVGSKLAMSSHLSVDKLVNRLADQRRRLAEFGSGDLDLRARLRRSYCKLDSTARRALSLMSGRQDTAFSVDDVAAMLGKDPMEADAILDQIFAERLLQPVGDQAVGEIQYWRPPDLVRIFVQELSDSGLPPVLHIPAIAQPAKVI
ncbi:BTAD domain-containing putative transcriptional regulator [Nonomuraea sp. NPDC003804]|uniref:AfsR/SARP family transcriptional regulator n=1 Tax=Nonomuraea sp. NPDC003804 TaxID=3154547 RepID=UPI0033AF38E4